MRSLQLYLAGVHSRPDALAITTKQNRSQAEGKEFNGIKRILDAENSCKGYPVIWFEAWLYQAEDVPIVALLHEIRRQFSPGSQFWEMLTVSGRTALEASLLMLDPLAKAIEKVAPMASLLMHAVGSVAKASEKVERDRFEVPLSSDQIRVQLNQAVKTILGNFKKGSYDTGYFTARGLDQPEDIPMPRLTIIIDDLDRCEPAMAIRLLEGLKIFLNIEHCVFVLGVNPRRLTDHIANLYRNEAKAAASEGDKYTFAARDYLDKIIGAHFTLGVAGNTSNANRGPHANGGPGLGGDEETCNRGTEASPPESSLLTAKPETDQSIFGYPREVRRQTNFEELRPAAAHLVRIPQPFPPGNHSKNAVLPRV
jgi:hypothetical protein